MMLRTNRWHFVIAVIGTLATLTIALPAEADPPTRRAVSLAYDWGGSSDVISLYKVPKGQPRPH